MEALKEEAKAAESKFQSQVQELEGQREQSEKAISDLKAELANVTSSTQVSSDELTGKNKQLEELTDKLAALEKALQEQRDDKLEVE